MSTDHPTPLRQAMDRQGRKQSWLADQVGCSTTHMSWMVKHGFIPPEPLRTRIAEALGLTVEEVFPAETAGIS